MDANTSLFLRINDFARATPWLHGPLGLYAGYGLVVFAGLLLVGWWIARTAGEPARMVAALWAPLGMLLALALNQPIGAVVNEARPYASLPNVLVLATPTTPWSPERSRPRCSWWIGAWAGCPPWRRC